MYGKNHHYIVISPQLKLINLKKERKLKQGKRITENQVILLGVSVLPIETIIRVEFMILKIVKFPSFFSTYLLTCPSTHLPTYQ